MSLEEKSLSKWNPRQISTSRISPRKVPSRVSKAFHGAQYASATWNMKNPSPLQPEILHKSHVSRKISWKKGWKIHENIFISRPLRRKIQRDENELQRIRGWCSQERRGDKDKNAAIANLIESFQSIGLIEFEANKTDVQRGVIR